MSYANINIGIELYRDGDEETRNWFHRQWAMWPDRADEDKTTNGSLHFGGVVAYRTENGTDPEMSESFAIHVGVMDKYYEEEKS